MNELYLTKTFNVKYPIIMAPMFLVTNNKMMIAAAKTGILGCIPSLNFRNEQLLDEAITHIKKESGNAPMGINLIVNKSNIYYEKHLEVLKKNPVDFIITSLGSPEKVINTFRGSKTKVFCDVTDLEYAKKCESLGADAVIAVNSGAGGHAGKIPASILIPLLKKNLKIPVISAGGVGTGSGILSMLALGAEGFSIGTPFIATTECDVSDGYKNACVDYHAQDIVMTTKLSGTPCSVINTEYVKKIGTEQNAFEKLINQNKKLKKYAKMMTMYKGTKLLEKAAFSATYQSVWCAGPSLEFTNKISSIECVVQNLMTEYELEKLRMLKLFENK